MANVDDMRHYVIGGVEAVSNGVTMAAVTIKTSPRVCTCLTIIVARIIVNSHMGVDF